MEIKEMATAQNVSFKLTPDQIKALDKAAESAGMRRGQFARAAFEDFVNEWGIDWPPDANTWGGPREAKGNDKRRRKPKE